MNRNPVLLAIGAFSVGVAVGAFATRKASFSLNAPSFQREYAMNVVVSAVPFWTDPRQIWARIGRVVPNVKTTYGGPTDTDASKQIDEIYGLLNRKINGIVIAPCDSKALIPVIDKAASAGIPVVTAFADSPGSKRLTYVGLSQRECGRQVAESLIKDFPNLVTSRTKIVILLAKAGIEDQQQRADGFADVIRQYNLELVQMIEDDYDESKGAEAVRAVLAREPDVKVVFGCDSRSAVGAVSALRESNRKAGDVIVTGWDYDEDVLHLIKEEWVHVTAAQYSSFMTVLSFAMLEAQNLDYLYPEGLSLKEHGVSPIPPNIHVPVALVTRSNVDAYFRKGSAPAGK